MADLMPMIQAERGSLAEFLGTLTPEQWRTQTLCDKWKVQDVVGHLVAAAKITAGHFFTGSQRRAAASIASSRTTSFNTRPARPPR